ncbi:MAG TPA: hypothetical protein VFU71_15145 [Burkholderiaceae bacterium]|nr:hypothetical protein [Burkholderiaceae bacterium]
MPKDSCARLLTAANGARSPRVTVGQAPDSSLIGAPRVMVPTVKTASDLTGASAEDLGKSGADLGVFNTRLESYKASGETPVEKDAPGMSWRELGIAILLAPIAAIGTIVVVYEEWKNRTFVAAHTEYRKDFVGKAAMIAITNIVAAGGVAYFAPKGAGVPWLAGTAVPLVAALLCVGAIGLLALQQKSWKEIWTDRFLEIMAAAEHKGDHDLFLRAFSYYSHTEAQPDIPIPGRLALYTGFFSAAQGAVLLAQKWLTP